TEIAQRLGASRVMEGAATNVEEEFSWSDHDSVQSEVKTDLDGATMTHSNLKCFLDSITPIVQTYTEAKVPFLPFQNSNGEMIADGVKYYYLADLWNRFYEWSACGVGTSVRLPSGEAVIQYFVPYLSAIQLYTNESDAPVSQRNLGWHSNNNIVHDTRFDVYNQHVARNWMDNIGYETPSHMYKIGDERSTSTCKEELFFKYFELDSPYERMPFVDKLSCEFPDLTSLRSIDLSPSSWMSIYWYPLGHVPARNKKDLGTCFLTYHSLSTSEEFVVADSGHSSNYVALAPFGLATHKMDTGLWASPNSGDQERIASLIEAAQSWIRKHDIQHRDFNFFSRSN
ncbi:hypothetical protein EJB05_38625, partial [Eragrostis curvula]